MEIRSIRNRKNHWEEYGDGFTDGVLDGKDKRTFPTKTVLNTYYRIGYAKGYAQATIMHAKRVWHISNIPKILTIPYTNRTKKRLK